MWKTYPQYMWISVCLLDCNVESVENLSTAIVDN